MALTAIPYCRYHTATPCSHTGSRHSRRLSCHWLVEAHRSSSRRCACYCPRHRRTSISSRRARCQAIATLDLRLTVHTSEVWLLLSPPPTAERLGVRVIFGLDALIEHSPRSSLYQLTFRHEGSHTMIIDSSNGRQNEEEEAAVESMLLQPTIVKARTKIDQPTGASLRGRTRLWRSLMRYRLV